MKNELKNLIYKYVDSLYGSNWDDVSDYYDPISYNGHRQVINTHKALTSEQIDIISNRLFEDLGKRLEDEVMDIIDDRENSEESDCYYNEDYVIYGDMDEENRSDI